MLPPVAKHLTIMTAFGYWPAKQSGWTTHTVANNLTRMAEDYATYRIPSLFRIDCVGCINQCLRDPNFACGVVCHNASAPGGGYRLCNVSRFGDNFDWDDRVRLMHKLATPALASGALAGIHIGDEMTALGMPFADLERYIDLVRGLLGPIDVTRKAAGLPPLMIYYVSTAYATTWPRIPQNLTHFAIADYHPDWMYPGDGVRDIYEHYVFPRLGPKTKAIVVPPVFGSDRNCTTKPSVWCINITYGQWVSLNLGNLSYYLDWANAEPRIAGLDPWMLDGRMDGSEFRFGLLEMPEVAKAYAEVGRAIVANRQNASAQTPRKRA